MTTQKSEYQVPGHLDMGIWTDTGDLVWLPKQFFPTRTDAKRFAMREGIVDFWIDARVRTKWMRLDTEQSAVLAEECYVRCERDDVGAFECWEIW